MYDTMPTDNHEAFAGLTESQLKPLLPAAVLAEYVRDGQPAQPGDPDRCKVAGKYVRALRDYAGMRDTFFRQRTVLVDQIEAGKRDQQYVEEALADAKTEVSFFETEKATIQALVKKFAEQRDAVLAHLRRIEKSLAGFKAMIDRQLTDNQRMANQIGAIQFKARQIDQQTRVMAQATAGAAH
jgi:molybdopterin converting factor small subunit